MREKLKREGRGRKKGERNDMGKLSFFVPLLQLLIIVNIKINIIMNNNIDILNNIFYILNNIYYYYY